VLIATSDAHNVHTQRVVVQTENGNVADGCMVERVLCIKLAALRQTFLYVTNFICNEFWASVANKSLAARRGALRSIASTLWLSKLSLPSSHVEFLISQR